MGQTATGGVLFFLPLADKEQATGQLVVWGRTQEEEAGGRGKIQAIFSQGVGGELIL